MLAALLMLSLSVLAVSVAGDSVAERFATLLVLSLSLLVVSVDSVAKRDCYAVDFITERARCISLKFIL